MTKAEQARIVAWRLRILQHVEGERRMIILSKSLVSNYMAYARKRWRVFEWMPDEFKLGEMKRVGDTIISGTPHLSSTTYKKEVFHAVGDQVTAFCGFGIR